MFAIRFDSAKNAAIAPMSQMSSSEKPCARSAAKSSSTTSAARCATFSANASIAFWRGVMSALPVVDGDLVGDERVLRVDAQDRAVGDDAVEAVVGAGRGDDDHLALGLA